MACVRLRTREGRKLDAGLHQIMDDFVRFLNRHATKHTLSRIGSIRGNVPLTPGNRQVEKTGLTSENVHPVLKHS